MPELANDLGLSKKIVNVKASGIRIFDNKVSTIPGIIKLTLGEPDMNTPEHVKQAAIKSIADNDSHYAPQQGKLELTKARHAIFPLKGNIRWVLNIKEE